MSNFKDYGNICRKTKTFDEGITNPRLGAFPMNNTSHDLKALLEEIERLKLENAILRKAAGIRVSPDSAPEHSQVTQEERHALLRKTV